MKQLYTLLVLALFIGKTNYISAQVNVNDSLALVDLYNSTDGAHWNNNTNWLNGPVSSWYGIAVSGDRVYSISLVNNNLNGTLPSSLSKLSQLTFLELTSNYLTGAIPSSLGNLTNLTELFLNYNQLNGHIPSSVGNLINLYDLALNSNQLTGSIPPSLSNLTKVVEFNLDHNQLSGNIPSSFGSKAMINLDIFALSNNQLTGRIPASLSHLGTSVSIELENNQLSGSVPTDFLNLGEFDGLFLSNNFLTFDGIEDIVKAQPKFYFTYSPQQDIPITYIPQNIYGKLSVHAGGTLSNNTYQWYKNNSLYKTIIGDSTFLPDSEGTYFVKVNNSIVTNLQLVSDTINIVAACALPPYNAATNNIQSASATITWNASQGAIKYQVKYKVAGGSTFTTVNTKNTSINLTGLSSNTKYIWKVRAKCSLQFSDFTSLNKFTTLPAFGNISQSNIEVQKQNSVSLYPNPATNFVNVAFNASKQTSYSISIYDLEGKMVLNKTGITNFGNNNYTVNVHSLSAAIYLVKIHYDGDKIILNRLMIE